MTADSGLLQRCPTPLQVYAIDRGSFLQQRFDSPNVVSDGSLLQGCSSRPLVPYARVGTVSQQSYHDFDVISDGSLVQGSVAPVFIRGVDICPFR